MISEVRLKEWVNIFLDHIKEITPEVHVSEQEGYKFKSVDVFQNNFNLTSPNLTETLEKSIQSNNLTIGSMYFPRKMLLIFSENYREETRQILAKLFDDSVDIVKRINEAEYAFEELIQKRNKEMGESANSFIGLRFISLILSFYNPNKYNALKPREWNVFCKYIDEDFRIPNGTLSGERYEVLSEYIEALRVYIKDIPEIKSLKEQLTRGLNFTDEEFRWITQDVIYVTARLLAQEKSGEEEVKVQVKKIKEEKGYEIEMVDEEEIVTNLEFPLEAYLENTIIKNWNSIDFGEPLTLYKDEDDTIGQQYITDVGIIDILTKDKEGNFVVIELKRGRSDQKVIGQILSYIGWVRENLATNGEQVRGIVIASDGNNALLSAQREVSDKVKILYYRVKIDFVEPKEVLKK